MVLKHLFLELILNTALINWLDPHAGKWVPTVQWAHQRLLSTLRDMRAWQTRAEDSKKLLQEMLVSRRAMAEIKLKHDVR